VTGLAVAVERQEWRLVALYLLLGVSRAAAKLSPETLNQLLDLLGGDEAPQGGDRRDGR
jgi:hypothetical protein